MAVDTRDKRASAISPRFQPGTVYPNPDGSLANQGDRQQIGTIYRGINASGATPSSLIPQLTRNGNIGSNYR